MRHLSIVLLLCSVFLDILSFKWRKLADFIIYFNCLTSLVTLVFPSAENQVTEYYLAMVSLLAFICFYTDSRAQVFAIVIFQILAAFVVKHYIYKQELTGQVCIMKAFLVAGIFFVNSILAMLIQYISQLHASMKLTNQENSKLLNGMHEGLLIVTRTGSPYQAMFCNKSAQKLLSRTLNHYNRFCDGDALP